jgi:hypothetical protein
MVQTIHHLQAKNTPQVVAEVTLSRPGYRVGGTVVGTVRIYQPLPPPPEDGANVQNLSQNPRALLASAKLVIAGKCRLDSRWHNVKEYRRIYGQHPSLSASLWKEIDPTTVCFWATDPLELLDLHERSYGSWEDEQPHPIHLDGWPLPESLVPPQENEAMPVQDRQLSFTFRTHIPDNLPHSLTARSCRIYYTILLCVQVKGAKEPQWTNTPLTILSSTTTPLSSTTPAPHNSPGKKHKSPGAGRVTVGTAHAMCHSSGLPCHVTPAELHQLPGRLTVHCQGHALYRNTTHPTTMRITTDQGKLVGMLALMGLSSGMSPGSRALLQFVFPSHLGDDEEEARESWAPCHQVCACLEGEEYAIHKDGSRTKAQSFLFSSDYVRIDPDCTESASLHLLLPLDAPCTVSCDVIEIQVRCRIDITVATGPLDSFQQLHLDIPCTISHSLLPCEAHTNQEEQDDAQSIVAWRSPDAYAKVFDPTEAPSFPVEDIEYDLVELSLALARTSGLWKAHANEKYIA